MTSQNNSSKTFERLWDVLTEIAVTAAKIKDKKLNQDAGKAIRLLERLGKELQMEDQKRGKIQIFC